MTVCGWLDSWSCWPWDGKGSAVERYWAAFTTRPPSAGTPHESCIPSPAIAAHPRRRTGRQPWRSGARARWRQWPGVRHGTADNAGKRLTRAFVEELFGPGQPLDARTTHPPARRAGQRQFDGRHAGVFYCVSPNGFEPGRTPRTGLEPVSPDTPKARLKSAHRYNRIPKKKAESLSTEDHHAHHLRLRQLPRPPCHLDGR